MEPLVLGPDEGELIPRPAHGSVTIKVANGAYTIFEARRPAGEIGGPARHSHPGFDETFYVLSGEWRFEIGGQTLVTEPGTLVHVPRGTFHSYQSTGRLEGRVLVTTVPGGIEDFFEASGDAEDPVKIAATGQKHGIVFEADSNLKVRLSRNDDGRAASGREPEAPPSP